MPRRAQRLKLSDVPGFYEVTLDDGTILLGRAVVIATGARYRKLGVGDEERFQSAGLYYAATELEARACKAQQVVVVGGGNSAGQAAMFLSSRASCVRLVHRVATYRRACRNIWLSVCGIPQTSRSRHDPRWSNSAAMTACER